MQRVVLTLSIILNIVGFILLTYDEGRRPTSLEEQIEKEYKRYYQDRIGWSLTMAGGMLYLIGILII